MMDGAAQSCPGLGCRPVVPIIVDLIGLTLVQVTNAVASACMSDFAGYSLL